ncbi:PorP/SprF family type IX secretion system membrane protein [Mucilaginibacter sp. HD30]
MNLNKASIINHIKSSHQLMAALFSFSILLFITDKAMAQQQGNFSYSQYADNLTPLNPAYSVIDKAGSVNLLGRKQFVGITGAPQMLLFNASVPIPSYNSAAGLIVLNDQFAVERLTEINGFFAKSIQLTNENYLAVSLNIGVRSYAANYSSLDYNDPQFKDDVRQTTPNLGFGVMFYGANYYVGVSLPELTLQGLGDASVQKFNYLKDHYYFAAGYLTTLSEEVKFKPAMLISYSKGTSTIANLSGSLFLKEQLGLGFNYNTNKQMAGILSINSGSFKIGYSYAFNTSGNNLGGFNNATNELSLSYRFGTDLKNKLL